MVFNSMIARTMDIDGMKTISVIAVIALLAVWAAIARRR